MKYNILTYLLLVALLPACTKTIDFEIPDKDKKIVLNGIVSNEGYAYVHLSKSRHILEPGVYKIIEDDWGSWEQEVNPYYAIDNAEVELFEDGQSIGKFSYSENGDYYLQDIDINANSTYKVEVKHNTLENVSAKCEVSSLVEIISIDTATVMTKGDEWSSGYNVLQVRLKFKDPVDEENYYSVKVYSNERYVNVIDYETEEYEVIETKDNKWLESNDLVLFSEDDNGQQLSFSDDIINGKTYELVFSIENVTQNPDMKDIEIAFESISPEIFKYIKSASAQGNFDDEIPIFTSPVQVYNNIENGFGIFGSVNTNSFVYENPYYEENPLWWLEKY